MAQWLAAGPMLLKVGCCQKHSWPSPAWDRGSWEMTGYGGRLLIAFQTSRFVPNPPQNRDSSHCTGEYCLAWTGWGQAWTKPRREASPLQLSHRQSQTCNSQIVTFSVFLAVTALTQESLLASTFYNGDSLNYNPANLNCNFHETNLFYVKYLCKASSLVCLVPFIV